VKKKLKKKGQREEEYLQNTATYSALPCSVLSKKTVGFEPKFRFRPDFDRILKLAFLVNAKYGNTKKQTNCYITGITYMKKNKPRRYHSTKFMGLFFNPFDREYISTFLLSSCHGFNLFFTFI